MRATRALMQGGKAQRIPPTPKSPELPVERVEVALEFPLQPGLLAVLQQRGTGCRWRRLNGRTRARGHLAPRHRIGPQAGAGNESVFQRVALQANQCGK